MGMRVYSKKDHERAFEAYFVGRTWEAAANEVGADPATVRTWALPDFNCRYGCPFHGWDRLLADRETVTSARMRLYAQGVVDPLVHDQEIREAVPEKPDADSSVHSRRERAQYLEILNTMVRSDLERVSHWEFLYAKVFYQTTGLVLDHKTLETDQGVPFTQDSLRSLYAGSLKVDKLENAIKALQIIQGQIDKIKEQNGVYAPHQKPASEVEAVESVEETAKTLDIVELRRMKTLVENTPPEQLQLLAKVFRADESILANLNSAFQSVPEETANP